MTAYDRQRMHDCLVAQARLCERMAAESWDEIAAAKFIRLAKECHASAELLVVQVGGK
jgi:hypothetical protein